MQTFGQNLTFSLGEISSHYDMTEMTKKVMISPMRISVGVSRLECESGTISFVLMNIPRNEWEIQPEISIQSRRW